MTTTDPDTDRYRRILTGNPQKMATPEPPAAQGRRTPRVQTTVPVSPADHIDSDSARFRRILGY
ncbi:hypothetical protein O7626_18850 [Micromonospora sp. WMMD1102]|uniref:hypothetical protein n=1 Tax=Micromonospora sp. WMMD1102 TaxID=3016105 RepID=UPI002414FC38|nr:hypothetical protein [Micromonospora sp. WMMD1102]MDG4787973.1 hypothetical protein [Micromonospora sp. WMMD1102]